MKSALIIGGSGLVGNYLLKILLEDDNYSRVIALMRKPLFFKHEKLEQKIVTFDNIQEFSNIIKADDLFCCLGTTLKQAGSKEAFYKVDHTYTVNIAKIAVENGAKRFFGISAIGANPSSYFFYNRVKGEMEASLLELPFKEIAIFRPSFISGKRKDIRLKEFLGISFAKMIFPFIQGELKKYKPISAEALALSMAWSTKRSLAGNHIYESDEILRIYQSYINKID